MKKINKLIASSLSDIFSAVRSSQTLLLVTMAILVGLGSGCAARNRLREHSRHNGRNKDQPQRVTADLAKDDLKREEDASNRRVERRGNRRARTSRDQRFDPFVCHAE